MMSASTGVLWINHFAVPPAEGGGTRHFEIGRELINRNWRVTIAAADYHYQSRRYTRRQGAADRSRIEEVIDGVAFQWLWSAPYTKNDWRRVWNWISFGRESIASGHSLTKPDVVIGSSPHLFAGLAGLRLARRWGVPFVLEVRDLWPESIIAAGGRKGPAYYGLGALARYLYSRADRIVCLARGTMTHLQQHGVPASKLVYVPNGVDPSAFPARASKQTDGMRLVYAGAHGPANGLDVVLDAAERLLDRPDIRFLLVGDGPAKKQLQEAASRRGLGNVEFRDPVAKSKIPQLFGEVDAGLMVLRETPLFSFGVSPNKLFDYFGASLPVVCNVPGEVASMVSAANAGEQAAPGSAQSLADAVLRLAARPPGERAKMGENARAWVSSEHSRSVLADRLDAVLREVLPR